MSVASGARPHAGRKAGPMVGRIVRGAAAVFCVAGGLLLDAQLIGSGATAGAQASSCAGAAALLIAHQDGSINEWTPTSPTCSPAPFYGSMAGRHAGTMVGLAATPSGGGYWLVNSSGGVFTFGYANFYGSLGNVH